MKKIILLFTIFVLILEVMSQNSNNKLTDEERFVILEKGTERPFTGAYYNFNESGTYICKQCNTPLFRSTDKFESGCGWPSFDDEIVGAIKRTIDADGSRTEITCAKCDGHLGHVFKDEMLTQKNVRHCVNSLSLSFVPEDEKYETAIFAGGCFWGVEYLMQKQKGVVRAESGYIGGVVENPTYENVCSGKSGYAEAVEVLFDPEVVGFETLARYFFELHDPTQLNGQGPDIGTQYRSEIFYTTSKQKVVVDKLILLLKQKGFEVVTKVTKSSKFYRAEDYHQNYYNRKGTMPYCHTYVKRF